MKSLDLLSSGGKVREIDPPLPRKITPEERKSLRWCPLSKYYVSSFTCLQCPHWELRSQIATTVTKQSGICVHPKKASRDSRKVTGAFATTYFEAHVDMEEVLRRKAQQKVREATTTSPKLLKIMEDLEAGMTRSELWEKMRREQVGLTKNRFNDLFRKARTRLEAQGKTVATEKSKPKDLTKLDSPPTKPKKKTTRSKGRFKPRLSYTIELLQGKPLIAGQKPRRKKIFNAVVKKYPDVTKDYFALLRYWANKHIQEEKK